MEQANVSNPLKEGLNVEMSKQDVRSEFKPRKVKPLHIILVIMILILFCGGIATGVYVWNKSRSSQQAQDGEEEEEQLQGEGEEEEKTCSYDGKTYGEGESFNSTDGCNTCTCDNGNVACTTETCTKEDDSNNSENGITYKVYKSNDPSFTIQVPSGWEGVDNVSGYSCTPAISAIDELGFLVEFHDETGKIPFVIYDSSYGCVIHDECVSPSPLVEIPELKYFYNKDRMQGAGYTCKVNNEAEYYLATILAYTDLVFTLEGDADLLTKEEFIELVKTFESDYIEMLQS